MLLFVGLGEHAREEVEQLLQGMEPRRLARRDVLDPALEPPGRDVGLRVELDDEPRLVLPTSRHGRIIARTFLASHKPAVKFL